MSAATAIRPTGRERFFDEHEVIVSKTDLQGRLTYANEVFLRISDYTEEQVLGQPHNIIRHPDMPRAVFQLLWDRITAGEEIFAYVVNMAACGDHYWVLAHVTPTRGHDAEIVGYHSNRRVPTRTAVDAAEKLYARIREAEQAGSTAREATARGMDAINQVLIEEGCSYDELVFSL